MAASSTSSLIRLGTCSWSTEDWRGTVYGSDTAKADFIVEYARSFNTVEVDSTFYGVPRASTLDAWREKTPAGFVFSAKVPQAITHDRFLEDCADELARFLEAMARLGDRLGPLVFQFPYYAKRSGVGEKDFSSGWGRFWRGCPRANSNLPSRCATRPGSSPSSSIFLPRTACRSCSLTTPGCTRLGNLLRSRGR